MKPQYITGTDPGSQYRVVVHIENRGKIGIRSVTMGPIRGVRVRIQPEGDWAPPDNLPLPFARRDQGHLSAAGPAFTANALVGIAYVILAGIDLPESNEPAGDLDRMLDAMAADADPEAQA